MKRLNTWRLALRIARRDARRAKGRSALVVAMIALPILVVSAADLTYRSGDISKAESLTRELGRSDARYTIATQGSPVVQSPSGEVVQYREDADDMVWDSDDRPAEEILGQVESALPDGATVLADQYAHTNASTRTGLTDIQVREIDSASPLVEGMLTLLRGDYPEEADEVAVTQAFLDTSGLGIGSQVTIGGLEQTYTITGAYELPSELSLEQAIAVPGSVLPHLDPTNVVPLSFLVDVPDGDVDWAAVQHANEAGLIVSSRSVTLNPPPADQVEFSDGDMSSSTDPATTAALITVVSLIILEICLLAGPAFAVGARRARRQLGLVGANGGDRRQLRAIMLASGLVLGAAAAVVGTLGGITLTLIGRPFIEEAIGARFGGLDFRLTELGGIALLAVVVGLLAAVVPAINAARTDVLESLSGRRGVRRAGRALPVVGFVALIGGAALAIVGAMTVDEPTVVAAGSIIAELGVVALTPLLVGGFGKLARALPLSGRLALRDAARNRGRTAPAVAAIMAATAGAVAVATVLVSDTAQQRAEYTPGLPSGTVALSGWSPEELALLDPARGIIEAEMPTTVRADRGMLTAVPGCVQYGSADCGLVETRIPEGNGCPLWSAESEQLTSAERRELVTDERCVEASGFGAPGMVVADPELLDVLDVDDPRAREALERGEVVALAMAGRFVDDDGRVTMDVYETSPAYGDDGAITVEPDLSVTLPVYQATDQGYGFELLMTPETAEAAGLSFAQDSTLYATERTPTEAEQQAVEGAMRDLATRSGTTATPYIDVEDGFHSDTALNLLVLSLAAGILALGAAGIATGLAQADSEADLGTLAAVGASPRVRRTLSGLQCGLIAAMGVVLGAVSGVIPAIALQLANQRANLANWESAWDNGWDPGVRPELFLEMPWLTFGQLIVVVPLVACLVAALLTRSRITLARRAG
ncbi:ABC transporter permease [Streptomyces hainanensis]|uniref:ABC transporter permease n=1 Tax=Streptomyces hainanensis TaxID=402648 RepID=A0A4R4TCI5_9ACTN|nr:ABC transporter permease [Streptomyces hainanensis]TDC72533.1 ABC transporter permease [Streptomyces hainanensis]